MWTRRIAPKHHEGLRLWLGEIKAEEKGEEEEEEEGEEQGGGGQGGGMDAKQLLHWPIS